MSQPYDSHADAKIDPHAIESATLLGHPRGLFLLFLVEMWERFSYYGMRAILVLYLVSVIAAHQLPAGIHSNTLTITEGAAGATNPASRSLILAVQANPTSDAIPQAAAPSGSPPLLRIERQRAIPDPADPENENKIEWVTDDGPADAPFIVAGEAHKKGSFDNRIMRFIVWNDTAAPIEFKAAIDRGTPDARTYFTVNKSPDEVTASIKPTAELGPDEEPFSLTLRANTHDSGRNWSESRASVLYGWYTGLAYLFPILGGIIADKLIGTHRSMFVGGLLIAIGHIILGVSGFGALAQSDLGMTLFMMGLAVIVFGTGHFKPTVSVMVGQLYKPGDPRRDGAFTIFYMGINLGAFLCAFICGTLGEKVGWHWGFGSAAVGMLAGLALYTWGKPKYLPGIGEAPTPQGARTSPFFLVGWLGAAAAFAAAYHFGAFTELGELIDWIQARQALSIGLIIGLLIAIIAWVSWFVAKNDPIDRGPIITIFVFMFFNAFFWIAFEQAGSSLNLFTDQNTDRQLGGFEVPTTWFQSVNAALIFTLAPLFAFAWTALGKRRLNPSQPVKIALGLIFLGIGYLFMVRAGAIAAGGAAKAGMWLILMTYLWHTMGELCLSPTGLSYVTKAAPAKFVSLLMGIWFISSFIANLGGGLVASQVKNIESGKLNLPWDFGGKADFFFLFVVFSIGPGIIILALTPFLKKLMRSPID